MSGALQSVYMNQRSFAAPAPVVPAIGEAYGGGFFAGQISTTANGVATHNLVFGPVSSAQTSAQWKTTNTATAGTTSIIDGPGNTAAMIAAGAAAHPCADFCDNLVIGGFSDWYMPAQNELEICYFNLKPNTVGNNTSFGINANAVPARASNYTSGNPAQTSATIFRTGGAQAFAATTYWTSTETLATNARGIAPTYGGAQYALQKNYTRNVKAVRRVPV